VCPLKGVRPIIVLTCLIAFVSINANADDTDSPNLQQILGIQPDAGYANIDLTTTAEGSVIMATVEDPSKIGGCLKGDRVELINLGNGEWKITRLLSGSGFNFNVFKEDGVMKIAKTETFGQKVRPADYRRYAKRSEPRIGVGARVSYVTYSDDDYTTFGVNVDAEPDDAIMFGVNLTFALNRFVSMELSVDYVETDVELSALGLSGDAGEVTSIPVLLSIRANLTDHPTFRPYLTVGGGIFFNDIDSNPNTAEFIYGPGAEFDVDNSFAFHAGGGIEVFLSENIAFNLDCKYIWTEIEGSVNIAGFSDEDFEFNPFVAGAGLKYYF
jgi:opacity protein-like surface antigen